MKYQNRIPPEGINTPGRHPVKEFIRLTLFAIVALLVMGVLLNYSGGRLGGIIPFKVETWIISKLDKALVGTGQESPFSQSNNQTALENYLNNLAIEVQRALGLSKPMSITLHYSPDETVNAYATLGGHVYLFKGLLEQLPHENALAMLMAHEFSHVQLRHPAKGIGSGVAVAIGTSLLPGGSLFENRYLSLAAQVSTMRFSRDMESQSDENGLAAVEKMYGHVNGADDLFVLFMLNRGQQGVGVLDSFFSTHPLDGQRIESLSEQAQRMGWRVDGKVTLLPEQFAQWLEQE